MKIVIDVGKADYELLMKGEVVVKYLTKDYILATLPEGHGKLKDTDKISARLERLRDRWNYYGNEYEGGVYRGYDNALDEVMDAPTIIEADKEVDK